MKKGIIFNQVNIALTFMAFCGKRSGNYSSHMIPMLFLIFRLTGVFFDIYLTINFRFMCLIQINSHTTMQ